MKTIVRIEEKSKRDEGRAWVKVAEERLEQVELCSRIAMIRALIPLGLEAVKDLLEQGVMRLVGEMGSVACATGCDCGWAGSEGVSIAAEGAS